ncbi:hypothetical protein J8F10_24275 [Gemmata sp. G18]|uniref:Uncharacterized protein n=1 Tax=Gemmata palustris TaxID=2822762 RepID=A0ABS5BZQ2_9BACT|nr:hypothetical protein [Gemmata palustris]MBP3958378.1 hypothetical protein [Gemmata palustris]
MTPAQTKRLAVKLSEPKREGVPLLAFVGAVTVMLLPCVVFSQVLPEVRGRDR